MKLLSTFCLIVGCISTATQAIPVALLYDHNIQDAIRLPQDNDVSTREIQLDVPIQFYGVKYNSLFINSNGLVSFQTEIPNFFNVEFPLEYPLIAPFYSNVDTRSAGTISYYETDAPELLERATNTIRDSFVNEQDFEAISLFIVTWFGVGYYNRGSDKINTFQVVIITDGEKTFVELLYPQGGIQWIQGTGDQSGLPDARGQAGFISADGKLYTLPGSGTEQVRNLENWSNINVGGQFIYRVDGDDIIEPDLDDVKSSTSSATTCLESPTACHSQANCVDYKDGFCCKCKSQYYGNGKFCVKKDIPLRVNGKVSGKINGERLENLDLQSYIVMSDARAYTAMSNIPESLGVDTQALQILGATIGYLFAKPLRNAQNGYQLTGGVFNHTATLKFLNTSQTLLIKQRYMGLDVFDQLKLEVNVQGDLPSLPPDAKVIINEYQEQYTLTAPGVIQMSSMRSFQVEQLDNSIETYHFNVEQVFLFDYCKFENYSAGETWKLNVGKNFIQYEKTDQIVRFGLSNKITPLGDFDPCEEGRLQCGSNSVCVVDGDTFRCVCSPGYQHIYSGNTTICADIDECQSGLHNCDHNAQCHNEIGSYTCVCHPGFEGDGYVCQNAASCFNIICPENSECIEENRVAMCRCLPGFTGDGQICTPVLDISCHTANNCHPFAVCSIDKESNRYSCACLPGYEGDGYACRKLDDGVTLAPPKKEIRRCLLTYCWCPSGYKFEEGTQFCIEDDGSEGMTTELTDFTTPEATGDLVESPEVHCFQQTCFCPKGFTLNKPTNSCMVKAGYYHLETKGVSGFNISCDVLNNCDVNAACTYSIENDIYVCQCNEGFEGDGLKCESEKPSCAIVDNCDPHATCSYISELGKSACVCNPGYEGDGLTCTITVCDSTKECPPNEECIPTPYQRNECVCKENYVRDSQNQCVDVANGNCGGGVCTENAECLYDNQYQVHYCACKSGFYGNGIDECRPRPANDCSVLQNCGQHASCVYNQSTTLNECQCNAGYFGNGYTCLSEINCHIEPTLCDPQAICVPEANQKFVCQCRDGLVGNGTVCKESPQGNFLLINQGMATLKIPFEPTRTNPGKLLQIRMLQTAVGLDVDCVEGRVYWGDINGMGIRSATYNGSEQADFITEDIGSPEGIAVDWVSRNVYWTDSAKDRIEVASIEGQRRRTLFNTGLVNPRGIAVHPQRGKIFWTDWDRTNPKIEWANADGTDREIFLKGESVALPNSLAIDYETEHLCYADAGTKKIECVDIDNKIRRTIATNCTYPFGITVTDKHIYWSDWILKKIERVEKHTLTRLTPLQVPLGGSGNKLYELIAVPQKCPQLTNVCHYRQSRCPEEHICLPDGKGSRRCVCTFKANSPDETPSCAL